MSPRTLIIGTETDRTGCCTYLLSRRSINIFRTVEFRSQELAPAFKSYQTRARQTGPSQARQGNPEDMKIRTNQLQHKPAKARQPDPSKAGQGKAPGSHAS